jgi:large subunit ribosomal protein L10
MARADKATAVAELADRFRSSDAAVLTEYRGLSVAELKELRRALGSTTTYAVVKNTLTKIAAKDAGVEGLDDLLSGPSAIAFVSGDPVEAAKGLKAFAKDHPALVIKGGYFEGAPITADEIKKLADLESREVLLAKLAGAMTASLSQAASLFNAPLSQAARLIEALRAKAEADPSILAGGAGTPAPAEAAATEEVAEAEVTEPEAVADAAETTAAPEGVADEAAEAADETPAAETADEDSPQG